MSREHRSSRRASRSAAGALLALVAAAAGGCGDAAPAPEAVAAGRKLFQRTCATCHGADAHGMPGLGKSLHENKFTRGLSDDQLVEFLRVGRPAWDPLNQRGITMPPRGGNPSLTDDDLRLIAAYLRAIG